MRDRFNKEWKSCLHLSNKENQKNLSTSSKTNVLNKIISKKLGFIFVRSNMSQEKKLCLLYDYRLENFVSVKR